jgi:hypothetical protein
MMRRRQRVGAVVITTVTIDVAADEVRFAETPATVVIDATREVLFSDDLAELEVLLAQIEGSYPVDILMDDLENGVARHATGMRICAAPEVLELLKRSIGMPVRLEALWHGLGPE